MGGSSSSWQDQSVNTSDASHNSGLAIGTRADLAGATIIDTDHGAVNAAFDFGNNALLANNDALGMVTDLAGDTLAQGFEQSTQALENADRQVSQAIGTVGAQSSTVAAYMRDTAQQVGELARSFQSGGDSDRQKMVFYGVLSLVAGAVVVAVVVSVRGNK